MGSSDQSAIEGVGDEIRSFLGKAWENRTETEVSEVIYTRVLLRRTLKRGMLQMERKKLESNGESFNDIKHFAALKDLP